MSLLMEALRKAEQAKRRMQQEEQAAREGGAHASPAFTLEEREPEVTPQYIRDNFLAQESATQDDAHTAGDPALGPGALADEAGPPVRQAEQRRQRAAAASVFAAKRKPARSRRTLAVLVTILVLMLPIGGGVLWYLLQASTSSIGLNPALVNYDLSSRHFDDVAATTPAPNANTVAAAEDDDRDLADTAFAEDATLVPAVAEAPAAGRTGDLALANATAATAPSSVLAQPAATPPAAMQTAAAQTPVPAVAPPGTPALTLPATPSTPVLEISRSRGTPQVNPDLVAAYTRLQEGDIAGAGALYRQVLAALPNNRDALLGLAAVHMREERPANARELYARLLQLNPRDPLAHTGLLQTMQAGSPAEHENTLKQLQAQYPNVAQLTLALGNHYAAQGRWSEAQAAYYNALLTARRNSNGPVHPDYAFNLAVSLEQLNQPKAALDYYRQAQALAADVTPGFDLQLLNSRLEYLLEQAPR